MSYNFDGVDDRIGLANPPANFPAIVDMMAWVKIAGTPGARHTVCLAYNNSTDRTHGLSVRIAGASAALAFESAWNGAHIRWQTDDDTLAFDTWYGIAATYDGSSDTNNPILYLKTEGGVISTPTVNEIAVPSSPRSDVVDSLWAGGIFGSYLFQGKIAYLRMFSGSIMNSAALDTELEATSAVAASPYLDLPFISDAVDLSSNGRDGTVNGATISADNPTIGAPGGGGSGAHYYRGLYLLS
jgi:hypothetical protein